MDATQATSITISMIYTALQAVIALVLFRRMRTVGLMELRYLFLSFTFAAAGAILGIAWTGFRILLSPLVAILVLPFVQATFHKNKPSVYKQLLAASIILYVYAAAARIAWQFDTRESEADAFYYSYLTTILAIYAICFGWFLADCIGTRRRLSASKGIEPWVKFRYVLLGISCVCAIATAAIPLGYPSHETFHEQAGAMKVIMAVSNVLFSVMSLVAWFMPARFKAFLNHRGRGIEASAFDSTAGFAGGFMPGKLDLALLMNIIEHLGNRLAPRINKSPGAAKGLLLVSIEAAEKNHGTTGIDFETLHDAIYDEVKDRLTKLGILDVDSILGDLEHDVLDVQSLLVVGKF